MSDFLLQRGARVIELLERIAVAQESIADSLLKLANPQITTVYPHLSIRPSPGSHWVSDGYEYPERDFGWP